MQAHHIKSLSQKENIGKMQQVGNKSEAANTPGLLGSSGAISKKSATAQQLVNAFEIIVECLKAKNSPEVVNFRALERSKITNFLKGYLGA
jgi:hypothetical protein